MYLKSVHNNLDAVAEGYNATIFAFGITGSGKTYTIFGENGNSNPNKRGISSLAIDYLFKKLEEKNKENPNTILTFKFSFLEIYNENVRDLLSEN